MRNSPNITTRRHQAGFTMVELAIVLVIAGIILVGALKGTDMINKAKIERVTADLKGLQGEADRVRLAMNTLPGDAGGPVLDSGGGGAHFGRGLAHCAGVYEDDVTARRGEGGEQDARREGEGRRGC